MARVIIPESLAASGRYEDFAKGPGARHGRSNSLKWPWLYDKLRAKGYDKSKAAAISNSRVHMRKKGRWSVLPAKAAHNTEVLKRLGESKGHVTKGKLTKGVKGLSAEMDAFLETIEFACQSKGCAPPPVGTGGSKGGGGSGSTPKAGSGHHPIITAGEARGDSRPVSAEEFQRLAKIGQSQLDTFKRNASPIKGLDDNLDKLKADTHKEVQQEWGGATIDSHTGKALPQGANKYAITVKDQGVETVSVKIGASKEEFDAAMDTAVERFRPILEREGHHLGVFRDDDVGRIDFDPVIVVNNRADVDTIGAASRSIGGAYNFNDGNGYWPPHVEGT